jgi:hypothetical protein
MSEQPALACDHRRKRMQETPLEAKQRELEELYKRLAYVGPLSYQRVRIQMQIARVRKQIAALSRNQAGPAG